MDGSDWVALAEITRPHGVRGELRLKVYNPDSDLLLSRPAELRLRRPSGEEEPARLVTIREIPGGVLAQLRGVDDRDAAEALRGSQLVVPRALLEEAEADEYYVVDLIGCEVMLDEARLGVVVDVQSYPTCDVLVVNLDRPLADPADPEAPPPEPKKPGFKKKPRRLRPPRLEVPMAGSYVRDVDLATRRVVLATIEGL